VSSDGTDRVPPLNMTRQEAMVLHAVLSQEQAGAWENADDGDVIRSLQGKISLIKHEVETDSEQ